MKPTIRCNDNLAELKKLPDKSVDLVYIDPPFDSNRDWIDFKHDSTTYSSSAKGA